MPRGRPRKNLNEIKQEKSKTTRKKQIEKKDDIIEYINKNYGKGKIFKLPEKKIELNPDDFVDSGSLCLNYIMTGDYRCGFPRKRPVEIYGQESVCKSTLALTVCKYVTKIEKRALYCDAEKGLNEFYAKQLKIDPKNFYYFVSDYGEESFEITEDLLKNFNWDVYVYDSIGGMRTRSVVEGGYDKKNMGDHAKLVGNSIIKLGNIFYKKNIAPIIVNQLGNKIGEYGNPNVTKGGKTLKFQLWVRIELTAPRDGKIEETILLNKGTLDQVIKFNENNNNDPDLEEDLEDEIEEEEKPKKVKTKQKKDSKKEETGIIVNAKTIKNKLFIPRRTCRLKLIYGKGFDKEFDFLEYLSMRNIVKRVTQKKLKFPANNEKSMLNSSFVKKYKEDLEFKQTIKDLIEQDRKSIQVIVEDENFLD